MTAMEQETETAAVVRIPGGSRKQLVAMSVLQWAALVLLLLSMAAGAETAVPLLHVEVMATEQDGSGQASPVAGSEAPGPSYAQLMSAEASAGVGSSAPGFRRIPGTDLFGGDITQDGHRGISIGECEAICAASSQCRGYTYVLDKNWCWPKHDVSRPLQGKPGLTSAVKVDIAEGGGTGRKPRLPLAGTDTSAGFGGLAPDFRRIPGTDLFGGDITQDGHRGISIGECEAICAASSQCRGYTYVLDKNWCWPKHDVSRPLQGKPGLTSAVKVDNIPPWEVVLGTGHSGSVTSVAIGPDGRNFATASTDGTVRLWDVATGGVIRVWTVVGGRESFNDVNFSADGRTLVAIGMTRSTEFSEVNVHLWDVETGRNLRVFEDVGGDEIPIDSREVDRFAHKRRLFSVQIWGRFQSV